MNLEHFKIHLTDHVANSFLYEELSIKLEELGAQKTKQPSDITFCSIEEMEYYCENASKHDFIIGIKLENTLFVDTATILKESGQYTFVITQENIKDLNELFHLFEILKDFQKEQEINNQLFKSMKELDSFTSEESVRLQNISYFIQVHLSLSQSLEKALFHFNEYLVSEAFKFSFQFVNDDELQFSSEDWIFKIGNKGYLRVINEKSDNFDKNVIKIVLNAVQKFYHDYGASKKISVETFWQEVFLKFPLPMAIMTSQGQLLYQNDFFSHLNLLPKKCIEFLDNQKIEIDGKYFICKKSKIDFDDDNLVFFQFLGRSTQDSLNRSESKPTFKELGIVSSSIAHELNNPLAGILSAVEVLELLGFEQKELEDINKAAKRCKELVSVFLGFARSRPNRSGSDICASNLFENALSLLRFRMIETGLKFEFDIELKSNQMNGFNASILTMIYYLILSDILTAIERKRLVTDSQQSFHYALGTFTYDIKSMKIELSTDIVSINEISFNKLIPNLLRLENLKLETSENSIQLILEK